MSQSYQGDNVAAAADYETLHREIAPFRRPSRLKSIWQLTNTLVSYVALWVAIWFVMDYSVWLTLPLILLAAGFLVRVFIIFHDCGHGSFFRSKRANRFWGVITGILTFTPYYTWRMSHARHHGTSGNLDKRGFGDVWTMTVGEYRKATLSTRIKYRLYRNPAVMFLLGPVQFILIGNRKTPRNAGIKDRRSVHGTNVGILALAIGLMYLLGWKEYLFIQFSVLYIGVMGGIWLFYVQHQFEGVYWADEKEWDFVEASIKGASYYKLPAVLRWFTGNIGYHHIHHLNPGIPNYYLPSCQKRVPILNESPTIGLFSSLKSLKYRLWDEQNRQLVSFRSLREDS
jgi:omega-6 fatty acid desaturase (delta-12 desaturase)